MVVSQNFSSATSLAMFAPMRTVMVMPSFPRITSEISFRPSGLASMPCRRQTPPPKLTWDNLRGDTAQLWGTCVEVTLMRDIPTASFLMWSLMESHTLMMNWWGTTKIRMSAPFTESDNSGTPTWGREESELHSGKSANCKFLLLFPSCQYGFLVVPRWGAACDRAGTSHSRGLCWWCLWVSGRSPSPRTPTCSLWCQTGHTWLRWRPRSWQWQSPCGHGERHVRIKILMLCFWELLIIYCISLVVQSIDWFRDSDVSQSVCTSKQESADTCSVNITPHMTSKAFQMLSQTGITQEMKTKTTHSNTVYRISTQLRSLHSFLHYHFLTWVFLLSAKTLQDTEVEYCTFKSTTNI